MVLDKMKLSKFVSEFEHRNNVLIINMPSNDARLKKFQKRAKQIADYNSAANRTGTFFMDTIINPNIMPLKANALQRKIIELITKGLSNADINKQLGLKKRQLINFKLNNQIVTYRCNFYDKYGWMRLKTDSLKELYHEMALNGWTDKTMATFLNDLERNDGVVYLGTEKIGKVTTRSMIRRVI